MGHEGDMSFSIFSAGLVVYIKDVGTMIFTANMSHSRIDDVEVDVVDKIKIDVLTDPKTIANIQEAKKQAKEIIDVINAEETIFKRDGYSLPDVRKLLEGEGNSSSNGEDYIQMEENPV